MINLLVIIKMRHTLKLIGLSLMMLLLAACGSEDTPSQALSVGTQSTAGGAGNVLIQKGPVANATVIVKTYEGQDAGKATTNADGQYKVDSGQPGLFIAEARDAAGKVYYSVGESANMNITELGDYLLRQWFQARGQDVGSAFTGGMSASTLPNVQELNVLANQIVAIPAYAMQKKPTELFGGEMTPTLAKILQGTTIESDTQLRINLPENNFNGTYTLKAPQLKKSGVVFEGSEETSSDNVEQVKGPIAASVSSANPAGRVSTNSRLLRAASSPMVGAASGGSNEHWMKDNWEYIKDKNLSELVIPGTHDSGTYQLLKGTGVDIAKTQTSSIGDQLMDGIRYFDLRVREAHHIKCADPSVWWLYHTWDSYRLQVALDEIVSFISKPGNENEVVILDFQDSKIIYDDERARNALLGMIQDKLKPYLVKPYVSQAKSFEDYLTPQQPWTERSMSDLVSNKQRVVVLLENGLYNRIKAQPAEWIADCYGKHIDYKNFSNRTTEIISAYDEDYAKSSDQIQYLISSELDQNFLRSALWRAQFANYEERWEIYKKNVLAPGSMKKKVYDLTFPDSALLAETPDQPDPFRSRVSDRVTAYKTLQKENKLRVLQLVSRPSDSWYAAAAGIPFGGDNLLSYAKREINDPLNSKGSCAEGWLGKRLRMGLEAPGAWNAPNIIITDNYKATNWVLPDYLSGKWVNKFTGNYVDMIIELNKIKQSERLKNVTDMQDGQCLQ